MKRVFFIVFVLLAFVSFAQGQTFYGTTDLNVFRNGRDKEFRNKEESPLLEQDFLSFHGLNYFPENKTFIIKANFTRTTDEKYFLMPTSSEKSTKFIKYGVLNFKIHGKPYSLNVYQTDLETFEKFPEYKDLLFIPFKDLSNGKETYGGGRYIDILIPKKKEVTLNFNLSYNPNCAYGSDRYSCPIPPKENSLQVEIKAGEKSFEYFGKKH